MTTSRILTVAFGIVLCAISAQYLPAQNPTIVSNSTAWTDDENTENGWTVFDGLIAQMAVNDDRGMGGDRVLVLPEEFATRSFPVTLSCDMMLGNYYGSNGVWAGVVLGVSPEAPSPSNGVAIIMERADSEDNFGGLRIHAGDTMSPFAPFGTSRYHPDIRGLEVKAFNDLHWVQLIVSVTEVDSANVKVSARVNSLAHRAMSSEVHLVIPRESLGDSRIALATSAQYGHGENPIVFWDNVSLSNYETVTAREYRYPSNEVMSNYLQSATQRLEEWPEFVWEPYHAGVYMSEIWRRLYRIKTSHPLNPVDGSMPVYDTSAYHELGAAAAYRVLSFRGDMKRLDEVIESAIESSGEEVNDSSISRWRANAQRVYGIVRAKMGNHQKVVDRVEEFLEELDASDARVLPLKVTLLHSLHHTDKDGQKYWALAEELKDQLPEGDWKDRVLYDNVVRLHEENRYEESIAAARTMLFEKPESPYSVLLVDTIFSGLHKMGDYETSEQLFGEMNSMYGEGSSHAQVVELFRGISAFQKDGDEQEAFDIFVSLAAEPTASPELRAIALNWALNLDNRSGRAHRESLLSLLEDLPNSQQKRSLQAATRQHSSIN